MTKTWFGDLGRLLLWLLLLPLLLLLLGPLLVLAAVRGSLRLGVINLNPSRQAPQGRWWALGVGVLLWGLTWGGLGWAAQRFVDSPPAEATLTAAVTNTPPAGEAGATASPTASPSPQPPSPTATAVSSPTPTSGPTPAVPSPTVTPISTATRAATATSTPLPRATATATATTTPTPTPSPAAPSPTPGPSPTPTLALTTVDEVTAAQVVRSLNQANDLLVEAARMPNPPSIIALADSWQGSALGQVRSFVNSIAFRYERPLTVTYSLVTEPELGITADGDTVVVTVEEVWVFDSPNRNRTSRAAYTYTMVLAGERWRIVEYAYRILSPPGGEVP